MADNDYDALLGCNGTSTQPVFLKASSKRFAERLTTICTRRRTASFTQLAVTPVPAVCGSKVLVLPEVLSKTAVVAKKLQVSNVVKLGCALRPNLTATVFT